MGNEIDDLREQIDQVDKAIVKRLDERARLVNKIGEIKREEGMELYVPGRERQILERLGSLGNGDFPAPSLKQIYREIIATCLNLEKPLKVAYLGPEATFTHSASLKQFGRATEHKPYETVSSVFDAIQREEADYGVVPIESSGEGAVRHTLDSFLESNLSITAECYLPIHLHLMGKMESIENVETLYSHPQALAQAREWIKHNLEDVDIRETMSTAQAAQIVTEDSSAAAIASEVAAEIYDLDIQARHIETKVENYTRFLVLGKQVPEPTGNDKTTVAFSVVDRPGALFETMVEPFGTHNINMTKIESRPSGKATWDYIFFVDFEGHRDDDNVAQLLEELEQEAKFFKVLGSYAREEPFE